MREPIPIALYQVIHNPQLNEPEKKDKGIITLARITTDFDPENFKPTKKHERIRWITESDLQNIEKDFEKRVPDFEQTLNEAFSRIKALSLEYT